MFCGQFGIVLASFRGRFDVCLTSLWGLFVPFLAHCWGSFLGCFYGPFCWFFWWCIETSNTKMSKMRQYNAKICNFPPKLTENGQHYAPTSLFTPIKHLFCLKTGQNRRFNLWKCAASGCVWKYPEVDFECFYALWWRSDDFWTVFRLFSTFFSSVFEPPSISKSALSVVFFFLASFFLVC